MDILEVLWQTESFLWTYSMRKKKKLSLFWQALHTTQFSRFQFLGRNETQNMFMLNIDFFCESPNREKISGGLFVSHSRTFEIMGDFTFIVPVFHYLVAHKTVYIRHSNGISALAIGLSLLYSEWDSESIWLFIFHSMLLPLTHKLLLLLYSIRVEVWVNDRSIEWKLIH